jgi:hypothetical protein
MSKNIITLDLPNLDRDTYVAFRGQWKTYYKELTTKIRALKLDVKNAMRSNSSLAGMHQNNLRYLQSEATEELETLKLAKARLKEITTATALAA